METLFHAARNSIYKIIKTDINESKKGHELQEICQTIGASGRTSWMSAIYSFKYGHQTSQQRYHMQVSGHTRPWDSNRLLLPLQVSLPASTRQYWQRNWKQINYVGQSSGEKQTNKPQAIRDAHPHVPGIVVTPATSLHLEKGSQTISEDTARWEEKPRCQRVSCFPPFPNIQMKWMRKNPALFFVYP